MNLYDRYMRYTARCEQIGVLPASFGLWQAIEPWLNERGRIAVLETLRADWLMKSESGWLAERETIYA